MADLGCFLRKMHFLKKMLKLAISSSRSFYEFFKKVNHTDCEIIRFEVERNVFFHTALQEQQTLTACGTKFSNYVTLGICTIVMHIMLGTCVPNLRDR
jgi:hypothetical protein